MKTRLCVALVSHVGLGGGRHRAGRGWSQAASRAEASGGSLLDGTSSLLPAAVVWEFSLIQSSQKLKGKQLIGYSGPQKLQRSTWWTELVQVGWGRPLESPEPAWSHWLGVLLVQQTKSAGGHWIPTLGVPCRTVSQRNKSWLVPSRSSRSRQGAVYSNWNKYFGNQPDVESLSGWFWPAAVLASAWALLTRTQKANDTCVCTVVK